MFQYKHASTFERSFNLFQLRQQFLHLMNIQLQTHHFLTFPIHPILPHNKRKIQQYFTSERTPIRTNHILHINTSTIILQLLSNKHGDPLLIYFLNISFLISDILLFTITDKIRFILSSTFYSLRNYDIFDGF